MAKLVSTNYKCKCGCQPIKLIFTKPSPYTGAFLTHTCPLCKSVVFIRCFKERFKSHIATFHTKYDYISPVLQKVLDGEVSQSTNG